MRTAATICAAIAAAVVVLAPPAAQAECAMPSAALFPLTDEVPANPTLYRFAPAYGDAGPLRIVDGRGAPVAHTARDVSTSKGLRVVAIDVRAASGTFTVSGADHAPPRTFRIAEVAYPAALPRWRDEDLAWIDDAWTCSHSRGTVITMRAPGAAAFRAVWPDGHEELVPPTDRAFWTAMMGGELDPAEAHIFLGHPSCLTDLVDPAYAARRDVSLVALYPDGTEALVGQPPGIGCGVDVAGHAVTTAEPPAPAPPPPAAAAAAPRTTCHHPSRRPPLAALAAALLGALATIVLVLLVRRPRARAIVP